MPLGSFDSFCVGKTATRPVRARILAPAGRQSCPPAGRRCSPPAPRRCSLTASRAAVRRILLAAALAVLAPALAGCNVLGPIAYYTTPPQIAKAEYKFKDGDRLAIVVDPAQDSESNPVFEQALTERVAEMFREKRGRATIVPMRDVVALRRKLEYRTWSVQRIGRELGASHVLYLKQERLALRESPDHPILHPHVLLRAKLIAVDEPSEKARVWPAEVEGREIRCQRPMQEFTSPQDADTAVRKLGYDTAYLVGYPFFDMDLEEPPRRES